MKLVFSQQIFEKCSHINLHEKVRPVGAKLSHEDRQTDRETWRSLKVAFRNFATRLKKWVYLKFIHPVISSISFSSGPICESSIKVCMGYVMFPLRPRCTGRTFNFSRAAGFGASYIRLWMHWRVSNPLSSSNLTLILLTCRVWRAPTNSSKWRMGFHSAFKGLNPRISDR